MKLTINPVYILVVLLLLGGCAATEEVSEVGVTTIPPTSTSISATETTFPTNTSIPPTKTAVPTSTPVPATSTPEPTSTVENYAELANEHFELGQELYNDRDYETAITEYTNALIIPHLPTLSLVEARPISYWKIMS